MLECFLREQAMGNIEEINFREGEFELSVRVEPQADTVWLNRQ